MSSSDRLHDGGNPKNQSGSCSTCAMYEQYKADGAHDSVFAKFIIYCVKTIQPRRFTRIIFEGASPVVYSNAFRRGICFVHY